MGVNAGDESFGEGEPNTKEKINNKYLKKRFKRYLITGTILTGLAGILYFGGVKKTGLMNRAHDETYSELISQRDLITEQIGNYSTRLSDLISRAELDTVPDFMMQDPKYFNDLVEIHSGLNPMKVNKEMDITRNVISNLNAELESSDKEYESYLKGENKLNKHITFTGIIPCISVFLTIVGSGIVGTNRKSDKCKELAKLSQAETLNKNQTPIPHVGITLE